MLTDTHGYWYFRERYRGSFLAVRALIMILIIWDTIRRTWFGSSPAERVLMVLEFPVTIFIAVEFLAFVVHGWQGKRRKRRLKRVVSRLLEGQELQQNWPPAMQAIDQPTAEHLLKRATVWVADTAGLLRKYSSLAAASFEHDEKGIKREIKAIGYTTSMAYVDLSGRLNRLQAIIDKADQYF